ncbi:MAG: glycosyltransferase family 2 protein, partial [Bacteroidales bacterium]|nr:glycosyltransferase family 2 protein [Bacteroidales bacterium]
MIYIILPVHNRKKITEKFIKCLVKQTYQDFKLILVDDGS